jgi:hypothetical protein
MDNFYKSCPPMMSDGRFLTDYRTAVRREEYNKYTNNIVRNDDYRLFLQNNANTIMNNEWENSKKKNFCWVNECVHNYPTRVYPPWFVEERLRYNTVFSPNKTTYYKCQPKQDYRLTESK